MRKVLAAAGVLAGLALWPAAAGASGGYGCVGSWTLEAGDYGCDSTVVISPGNDTRVNMLLLLRELNGAGTTPRDHSMEQWEYDEYGHSFFDWQQLTDTLYPVDDQTEYSSMNGTRCQSVEQGGEQFMAAVARNRAIGAADRDRLAEGRAALLDFCVSISGWSTRNMPAEFDSAALSRSYSSREARDFGTYISGAAAFYAGEWRGAKARFASLRGARDEWVREAARYMEARTALAEANDSGLNEWGFYDADEADQQKAREAGEALAAYLEAYPSGRFSTSARGLQRRARWIAGESVQQGANYARLLASVDAGSRAAVDLIDEVEGKFFFVDGAEEGMRGPLLLAVHNLMRMRSTPGQEWDNRHDQPLLTTAQLASHEAVFTDHPELFTYLQANRAYYIDHDYRRVLQLLPDDARHSSYSPLQFSRQMLRGMALAQLGDRNEVGFWRELIEGTDRLYQRPTVELGLALAWERAGQVDRALGPDSPIEDARVREILIEYSTGPEVLRSLASGAGRTQDERDRAAYVLLYRELTRGEYAAALRDLSLARAGAPTTNSDEDTYEPQIPAGVFASGNFTGAYACPSLRETLQRLSGNARDVQGRLCLGDFYRLNGFDQHYLDYDRDEGTLGSHASYPGEATPRSRFYSDIIAQRGVSREDRAYALYRAIHCYAPSGYSSCGGEQVAEEQRAAWFRRLKNEFGDTRWGEEAEYYW
ncbi:hypothetical protein [Aurantiacibacter gilvus]|uniref:Uncharacterized protein n=1 Tax=Aurantiacibacter gilvus TaxID=3139141 RepID=A0ABU9IB24_9SPHN